MGLPSAPRVLGLLAAVIAAIAVGPAVANDARPMGPTCFPPSAITALTVVGPHTMDVAADGKVFRLDLDPSCAGVRAGENIQVASMAGPVCADGKSAAVTASAICGVLAIRPSPAPSDRCFRIRDVRRFEVLRNEEVNVTLRGGGKRVITLEAACTQLDRLEEFDLISGANDGRICGHPQDALVGRPGEAYLSGFAKQFTANDFQPCRIMDVKSPEGDATKDDEAPAASQG
jgi:hypothetical protein